jgi:hypothetical protein
MPDSRHLETLAQLAHSDHATPTGPVAWDRCDQTLCRKSQVVLTGNRRPAMPDVRFGPPANVGEPVPAENIVVGEDVVARLVTELSEARADLARAEARTAGLVKSITRVVGYMEDAPELWGNPAADTVISRLRALAEADGQRAGGEGVTDA